MNSGKCQTTVNFPVLVGSRSLSCTYLCKMIGVFLPFLLLANYVCALHDFSALGHATDAIENEARLGKLDLAHEGTPDLHSSLSADKTPSQNHGSQPTLPLFPIVLGSSAFVSAIYHPTYHSHFIRVQFTRALRDVLLHVVSDRAHFSMTRRRSRAKYLSKPYYTLYDRGSMPSIPVLTMRKFSKFSPHCARAREKPTLRRS